MMGPNDGRVGVFPSRGSISASSVRPSAAHAARVVGRARREPGNRDERLRVLRQPGRVQRVEDALRAAIRVTSS